MSQSFTRNPEFRGLARGLALSSLLVILAMLTSACGVQVYNFGGSGTGERFVVPPAAAMDPDPVTQSWVAYSLARSACALTSGDEKPWRSRTFDCELRAREVLVQRWSEREDASAHDDYLDALVRVRNENFLGDYVWVYLGARSWRPPEELELDKFDPWRGRELRGHRGKTRMIGYWTDP